MGILFFGGWQGPGVDEFPLLGLVYFLLKTFIFYFLIVWTRMTFPRVRIDQIMSLNWKFMVPLSIILLMGMPVLEYVFKGDPNKWLVMLGFNGVLFLGALEYARRTLKKSARVRTRFPERPVAIAPKIEEEAAA